MMVSAQIDAHLPLLTRAERRVAAIVADDPEAVAFGTVADVARRSDTSGATVVRLAAKLGFDGFVELQAAVREEMARRLRPASERIRRPAAGDVLGTALAVEMANVAATLEGIDRPAFDGAVRLLSRRRAERVMVLSGDASSGIASLFADELSMLRPGVVFVAGWTSGWPGCWPTSARPTSWWCSTSPATTGRCSAPPAGPPGGGRRWWR